MNLPRIIEEYLQETLGMEQTSTVKNGAALAIRRLMNRNKISHLNDYEKLFQISEEHRQKLIDEIVVGETWFFRDKGPFDYLIQYARKCIASLAPREVLSVLSAPCSTGEEPYSIVMALFQAGLPPGAFCVDAVDVSFRSLDLARNAVYGRNSFREPIGEKYRTYFLDQEKGKQVTGQVVRQVKFMRENLILPGFPESHGPYHIIFCRNFLIYLTEEIRKRVFQSLDRLLIPGGLLFTGHSEMVFWQRNGYLPIRSERSFGLSKPNPSKHYPAVFLEERAPVFKVRENGRENQVRVEIPAEATGEVRTDLLSDPQDQKEKKAPGCYETKLLEARRLADKGELEQAIRICRAYTEESGPSADAYCLMGMIFEAANDLAQAESWFLKAIYLDPRHYESLIHVSLLFQRRGDIRKAALYRERAERRGKESYES
ncbi:MAG TPA: CheR family methyltransferase [Smithellaceae bacterium]|nr:CheR family methyltransferase [Smithellaceae bacterium]